MIFDTNLVSAFLRRRSAGHQAARDFVERHLDDSAGAISFVTRYEMQRGWERALYGQRLEERRHARRRLVSLEKFLTTLPTLGLDGRSGGGWSIAAKLWAAGQSAKPAINLKESDLLIAATAAWHERPLATLETKPAMRMLPDLARKAGLTLEVRIIEGELGTR